MDDILVNIGRQLKSARQKRNLTLQQVALRAGVSAGLISKIENLRTTPSLPVLLKIMQTLNIDLSELDLSPNAVNEYVVIRKGEGTIEEREDSTNLEYTHLLSSNATDNSLRVYLIKVAPNTHRKPISTNANELLYVISGKLTYLIKDEEVVLNEGDLMFFDGNLPHGLVNETDNEVILLKIYLLE